MDGIELCARFALSPNSRAYCGRKDFAKHLASFLSLRTKENRRKLAASLSHFTAHYAYLSMIAKKQNPFSNAAAESFWLGRAMKKKDWRRELSHAILHDFCGPGKLSSKKARALASNLPNGFLPHHTFHVLYIHTITGVISPSIKNAELCRPSWGTVLGSKGSKLIVQSQKLAKSGKRLVLLPCKRLASTSCNGITLTECAKKGDRVAMHWGAAVMKITKRQEAAIRAATLHNLAVANRLP